MAIHFFADGVDFQLPKPKVTSAWVKNAIKKERKKLGSLTFVFCSDPILLRLNSQYLKHDTLTDILTFPLSEDPMKIDGEIYISIDRVMENALKFKTTSDDELHRVIIHGTLHLIGYNDKSVSDKAKMREKEEAYLSLR